MVYCGKPSKGCSNCRKRKVKCDQGDPHCGQCQKRQLQCPGYRNLVDLMFRDESEHVIEKATTFRKRSDVRKQSPSPVSPCSSDEFSSPALSAAPFSWKQAQAASKFPPSKARRKKTCATSTQGWLCEQQQEMALAKNSPKKINPDLFLPCESVDSFHERGMAFFFSRHVARNDVGYQSYDFIYDVWKPPSNPSPENQDSIAAGVVAIGLAGLSKVTRNTRMMDMARRNYGAALNLTTTALSDKDEAVKDTTMLSVLLLSTYEVVSGSTPQTMEAWQKHVDGAAALATIRGTDQFKTSAGCKMFQMLCYSVLLSCMRSDIPAPPVIEELRNKSLEMGKLDRTNRNLIDHMFRTTTVRHQVKTGIITGRHDVISTLANCDAEWALLASDMPDIWRYRNIKLAAATPTAMHRHCHVYPGLIAAITWNGIRSTRMLLQEAIIEQLCHNADDESCLSSADQELLIGAIKTHNTLTDAIIASVPQFFGTIRWEDYASRTGADTDSAILDMHPSSAQGSETVVTPHEEVAGRNGQSVVAVLPSLFEQKDKPIGEPWYDMERIMTLAASCTSIVWPLYNIGISPNCSPEKRSYVLNRLMAIYEETGLENALEVAETVRQKIQDYPTQKCANAATDVLSDAMPTSSDI
ncbi:C6 finger domain [Cordyceps militaris]|uniref:C6 finger domain n=1 Tax=Cordyceps militaris TaxID=73501 RepID=A0A2H4S5Y8_CORMI|nr:C6 finger domain [Cordyceps militaris]